MERSATQPLHMGSKPSLVSSLRKDKRLSNHLLVGVGAKNERANLRIHQSQS